MWMVRAGDSGQFFSLFKDKNIVSIGWNKVGDLSTVDSPAEIKRRVNDNYSDWTPGHISSTAGQLRRFRFEISIGDKVVSYNPEKGVYIVGEVIGDYDYNSSLYEHHHVRRIKWLAEVTRDQLSIGTQNTLGAILTIFKLSTNAEKEIMDRLEGKALPEIVQRTKSETANQIKDILTKFKEHLQTDEAKEHIERMTKEIQEVKDLMRKLGTMDKKSQEFTDLVLYGLLPNGKSKYAKRTSIMPAFLNIKRFFKTNKNLMECNYSESDWNTIANKIYELSLAFQKNPEKLEELIIEFKKDPYSRGFQCGVITPILFCLHESYPPMNNRVKHTFDFIKRLLGSRERIYQKLEDYPEDVRKLREFVIELGDSILKDNKYFDFFCYWYDSKVLANQEKAPKSDKKIGLRIPYIELQAALDLKKYVAELDIASVSKKLESHELRAPDKAKIREIVTSAANKKWVIPHFQRYFDWEEKDVKDFLESIFNDYYVGTLLLWETSKVPEVDIKTIDGVSMEGQLEPAYIILDGQQRITALHYAIKAPENTFLKHSKSPWYFYVNFNAVLKGTSSEQTIVSLRRKLSKDECFERLLFPLYELENYQIWVNDLEDFMIKQAADPSRVRDLRRFVSDKLMHIWERFEIPYVRLPETMKIEDVTAIFERINTAGIRLGVFDLLIARLYKHKVNLRKLWDINRKQFPTIQEYFKHLDKLPAYIFQAISLCFHPASACGRREVLDIYKNVYEKNPSRKFEQDWATFSEYINKAILKLENKREGGFGVLDSKHLPFTPAIPILAALLYKAEQRPDKPDCYRKIARWYWSAIFTNAYSGAVDSQLTMDFRQLNEWFENDEKVPKTVNDAKKGFILLSLKDIESENDARYRGILSLIALKGAKDFVTGQPVEHAGKNDKDHIFPKSHVSDSDHANSILNITWNSLETNQKIKRAKMPSRYIDEFLRDKYKGNDQEFLEVLKTHFIDSNAFEHMQNDHFEGFLEARESVIRKRIQEALGLTDADINAIKQQLEPKSDLREILARGESEKLEFKSALRWDYKENKKNSKMIEPAIAKAIVGFLNAKGGMLCIGIDPTGQILGLQNDFSTLRDQNTDGFERAIIDVVNNYVGKEFAKYVHAKFEQIDNKIICMIKIDPSRSPAYLKIDNLTVFVVRLGNRTEQMDVKVANEYIKNHWT